MPFQKNSPRQLFVGILAYARPKELCKCIEAASKACLDNGSVFVLQNGMDDKSFQEIGKKFPRIHLISSLKSLGAAGGRNMLIKEFLSSTYDYILLLDSDVILDEQAITNFFNSPINRLEKIGAIGCLIRILDDSSKILSAGIDIDFKSLKEKYYNEKPEELVTKRDAIITAAVFIKREVFTSNPNTNLLFDERMHIYWEDVDWCLRLKRHRFQNFILGDSIGYHPQNNNRHTLSTQYYMVRNLITLFNNHGISLWESRMFKLLIRTFKQQFTLKRLKQPLFLNRILILFIAIIHAYSGRLGKAPEFMYQKVDSYFEYKIYFVILSLYKKL